MQTAPGKGFLKVVGILLIVFGAIGIILSVITLIGGGVAAAYLDADIGAMVIVTGIISLLGALLNLVSGIFGVKFCAAIDKAKLLMIFAIAMGAVQVIAFIFNLLLAQAIVTGIISLIIGLVLPALFLIGALKNKQAALAEAAKPEVKTE